VDHERTLPGAEGERDGPPRRIFDVERGVAAGEPER